MGLEQYKGDMEMCCRCSAASGYPCNKWQDISMRMCAQHIEV